MKAEIAESKAAILSMYDVNSWDFLIKFCIATRFRGLTIVGVPYFGLHLTLVYRIFVKAGLFHQRSFCGWIVHTKPTAKTTVRDPD